MDREAATYDDAVKKVRKETNDWVAKYRRDNAFSGRPSFGCVGVAVAVDAVLRNDSWLLGVKSHTRHCVCNVHVVGAVQDNHMCTPQHSNTYSALNALAGHYNSFGTNAPIPKKRLERIEKELGDAERLLERGR